MNETPNSILKAPLSDEDRDLCIAVAAHVRKHPSLYRDAGNWLDREFYDQEAFRQRMQRRIEEIDSIRIALRGNKGPFVPYGFKVDACRPVRARRDRKPDLQYGLKEGAKEQRELRRWLKEDVRPGLSILLDEGITALLHIFYNETFPSLLAAKAACIVTWLLTDPDAHTLGLGLTKFENWSWTESNDADGAARGYMSVGFWEDRRQARGYDGQASTWMTLLRLAWRKVADDCSGHDLAEKRLARPSLAPDDRVFLVHGQNEGVLQSCARLIEKLGIPTTILREQPNQGRTIIEKFIDHADVGFAVVLLTGDDRGGPKHTKFQHQKLRARQNVILELGFFLGVLGRGRVCALYEEGVEIPSDYAGVAFVPLDTTMAWHMELAREIKAAGFAVDLNKVV